MTPAALAHAIRVGAGFADAIRVGAGLDPPERDVALGRVEPRPYEACVRQRVCGLVFAGARSV